MKNNKGKSYLKKKISLNKGITLIALVITIVILLILAGILLKLVLGENGLIERTRFTSYYAKFEDIEDAVERYKMEIIVNKYGNSQKLASTEDIQVVQENIDNKSKYPITGEKKNNNELIETLQDTIKYTEGKTELSDDSVQLYTVDMEKIKLTSKNEFLINIETGKLYVKEQFKCSGRIYHRPDYGVLKDLEDPTPIDPPVGKILTEIIIEKSPDKIWYFVGDSFQKNGMIVKAKYNNGEDEDVTNKVTFNPTIINQNTTEIQVSYTENSISKSVNQEVNVEELSSIRIDTPPTKTAYCPGDNFDTTGMVVKGIYTSGAERDITESITLEDDTLINGTSNEIKIGYQENGIKKTTSQLITFAYEKFEITVGELSTNAIPVQNGITNTRKAYIEKVTYKIGTSSAQTATNTHDETERNTDYTWNLGVSDYYHRFVWCEYTWTNGATSKSKNYADVYTKHIHTDSCSGIENTDVEYLTRKYLGTDNLNIGFFNCSKCGARRI